MYQLCLFIGCLSYFSWSEEKETEEFVESILACISTKETAQRFAIENNADFVFQPFVTDFLYYAVVYGSTRLQQWMNAVNNSRSQQWIGFRLLSLPVYKLTTLALCIMNENDKFSDHPHCSLAIAFVTLMSKVRGKPRSHNVATLIIIHP